MEHVIMTYTGKLIRLDNPRAGDVCIEDIAHALSQINRYTGHTYVPYSVAQHSVIMSRLKICDPMVALLHDSAEAYIGDVASPLKSMLSVSNVSFAILESSHLGAIEEALGIPYLAAEVSQNSLKAADRVMLAAEAQLLLPSKGSPAWADTFEWAERPCYRDYVTKAKRLIEDYLDMGENTALFEYEFLKRYRELRHGE